MPSALVWSVESVVLGLWALVLASYSTPLHVFIARSHVLIASFTAVLHLVVISRNLVVGSAVSQAFLCAVSALFLLYVSAVLDTDRRYFKLPSVGLLTLDAVIGLAWFAVAMLSGLGMALSFIKRAPEEKRARTTLLMLHRYGVHLVVIIPCIALLSGAVMRGVCVAVWSVHLVYIAVSLFFDADITRLVLKEGETFQGVGWIQRIAFLFLYVLHLVFRFAAVAISLLVLLFVDMGGNQRILVFCLLGMAALASADSFSPLISGFFPSVPALDGYFGSRWEEDHAEPLDSNTTPAEREPMTTTIASSRFTVLPPPFFKMHIDPAAVSLREKMV